MNIVIKTRDQVVEDRVDDVVGELERIERELVDQIKESLENLITIETLYEIRDHIDNLVVNWVEEEVEL